MTPVWIVTAVRKSSQERCREGVYTNYSQACKVAETLHKELWENWIISIECDHLDALPFGLIMDKNEG